MKLYFKTKVNRNGNDKRINIDLEHKTYTRGSKTKCYGVEYIKIKSKDFNMLINNLKENGFVEV